MKALKRISKTVAKTQPLSMDNLDYFISQDTNRYQHIIGVINLAKKIEDQVQFHGDLVTASLYHDIGYSKKLACTKFHPIDSAIKAQQDNLNDKIINAILCHTGAEGEAKLINGNLMQYYENADLNDLLSKFLTYCDTHVNSKGEIVSLDDRLNDIYERYDKSHYVYQNIKQHEKYFKKIEEDINEIVQRNHI